MTDGGAGTSRIRIHPLTWLAFARKRLMAAGMPAYHPASCQSAAQIGTSSRRFLTCLLVQPDPPGSHSNVSQAPMGHAPVATVDFIQWIKVQRLALAQKIM
ncbi:MAG: hypothetical protein WBR18_07480 [Anaerolineales bacterium]